MSKREMDLISERLRNQYIQNAQLQGGMRRAVKRKPPCGSTGTKVRSTTGRSFCRTKTKNPWLSFLLPYVKKQWPTEKRRGMSYREFVAKVAMMYRNSK